MLAAQVSWNSTLESTTSAGSFSEALRLTSLRTRIAHRKEAKNLFLSSGLESRSKQNYQRRTSTLREKSLHDEARPVEVHVRGVAIVALEEAMKAWIQSRTSSRKGKWPRLRSVRTRMLNQMST